MKWRSWPFWGPGQGSATSAVRGSCWRPHGQAQLPGVCVGWRQHLAAPCPPPPTHIHPGLRDSPGTRDHLLSSTSTVLGQQPGTGASADGVLPGDGLSRAGSRVGPSNPSGLCPAPSCSPWATAVGDSPKSGCCIGWVGGHGGRVSRVARVLPGDVLEGQEQPPRCRGLPRARPLALTAPAVTRERA